MSPQSEAQYLPIELAGATPETELVPAIEGKKIRVLAFLLFTADAVTATFKSVSQDPTPTLTTLVGGLAFDNSQVDGQFNPVGWFETVEGEALHLDLDGPATVSGCLVYVTI